MDRFYTFKIQARADDPNDVLIRQFLPNGCWVPELGEYTFTHVYIHTEDAWSRIRTFCPEERLGIDWDSVTFSEIMYDEKPFPGRGKWHLCIHTTDERRETIDLRWDLWEDEEDFQRKVFEYLRQPDILGLQETKKLQWVIKCGLDGSSNSDVRHEFYRRQPRVPFDLQKVNRRLR